MRSRQPKLRQPTQSLNGSQAMTRSVWTVLALLALGLWASLLPPVTYPSASSGDPAGEVLIAWPEWAVQQDLGKLSGSVGRFHIWASAEPGQGIATVQASLVDAETRHVLRQTSIDVTPAYTPAPRTLSFPRYVVPDGQRLLLQLEVSPSETRYVVYGLSSPQSGFANLSLNGVPDAGDGPLAFAHVETGSGLRAAILGDPSGRVRIALAAALSALAIMALPPVVVWASRARTATWRLVRRSSHSWRRRDPAGGEPRRHDPPTIIGRAVGTPWYPWLLVTIPILHFVATNQLHFTVQAATIPLIAALACVTVGVAGLRLVLKDWVRPAAATAALTVCIFGYGHVDNALQGRVDDRALFAAAIVLAGAAFVGALKSGETLVRWTEYLNGATAILLLFPVVGIASANVQSVIQTTTENTSTLEINGPSLPPLDLANVSGPFPDIYYIILDEYSRGDSLFGFDNSEFLQELENRGFYIASEATSNYTSSIPSIASTLNMAYIHDLIPGKSATETEIARFGRFSSLVKILKSIGYTYIHLESGYVASDRAPLADTFVSFTPSGTLVCRGDHRDGSACGVHGLSGGARILSGRFLRELVGTTAFGPVAGYLFELGDTEPLHFWSPQRTLMMFEFLTDRIEADSPKFVMAHIVKPHPPATFDRYGNYTSSTLISDAFDDAHDPSVPNAFIGQLLYINSLTLKMIDSILEGGSEETIILISADHAHRAPGLPAHPILAAFRMAGVEASPVYASISSVNHFRAILDHQFELGLGLLDDRMFDEDLKDVTDDLISPL